MTLGFAEEGNQNLRQKSIYNPFVETAQNYRKSIIEQDAEVR